MGKETSISWTDSTTNPVMGCDGCELWNSEDHSCYAGVLHERYGGVNKGFSPTFDKLTRYPGRMAKAAAYSDLTGTARKTKPWLDGQPRIIFVSDMSDALSRDVSFEYLQTEIIDVVNSPKGQRHIWMWLTKRPHRMMQFDGHLALQGICWPNNLWAGTSLTTQSTVPRVDHLIRVRAKTRFISAEPMRGPIDLSGKLSAVQLVIAGGESGDKPKECQLEWVRALRDQCAAAYVPFFLKQLGANVTRLSSQAEIQGFARETVQLKDSHGSNWDEWTGGLADLRVRQWPPYPFAA